MGRTVTALLAALTLVSAAPAAAAAADPEIRVLSNRADLISGGDALVQVVPPAGVDPAAVRVDVDGRDVTAAFAVRPDGRFLALLEGLKLGDNEVTATVPGGGATLRIVNHLVGGPVTSGPQIQPWTCFEGATDLQCNRPVRFEYLYKPTGGGGLAAYDPANPPSDVATTTTDQGKTVPFIVRHEIGAIDRDEYRIASLYDPGKPWAPWAPQDGFNHKLVIFHGASCDTAYEQAEAPDVLNEAALAAGFATMSHALNNAGHNCNIATQFESMLMTKEHLIEELGEIRYTIGSGCSGGSLVQQQIANAYPGFYQGITPACSFTDAWSSAMQYVDYEVLRRYFETPQNWEPGVVWGVPEIAAVEGHVNPVNPITFTEVIPSSGNPSRSCPGVAPERVYDAQTNPKGVRCSFHDYMVNVFGRRKKDGFAGRPADNVGIEYGLKALMAGKITPAQFADLNAKIGSWDIDYNPTTERVAADRPALENVYRSGAVNQGDNLDEVAIIDLRGPDPGAFHDVYRTYVMRARLDREHGHHDNQILWRGQVPLFGDVTYADAAIFAVDKWLSVVEKDPRDLPLARKLLMNKPEDIVDRCTNGAGLDIPAAECDAVVVSYSSPRIEAGMPFTDDTIKCELKPLRRSNYYPVVFSPAEWEKLVKVFPEGVCDYTKPGVDRVKTVPWLTFQDGPGGRALGSPPRSVPLSQVAVAAPSLGLPPTRRCVGRSGLRFKVAAPAGRALRSASVFVYGQRARKLRGAALGRRVRLRSLAGVTVRVRIVAVDTAGKRITAERTYRLCGARKRV